MRNTPENRADYWKDSRRFLLGYALGVLVGALLFRWALHESNEVLRSTMFLIPGVAFLGSAFAGGAACEIYFTMKGFEGDWYDAKDSFPRWFATAKVLSSVSMAVAVGLFIWLVATVE